MPLSPQVQHAPGCYYVNLSTGTIQRQCNPLLATLLGQVGFTGQQGITAGLGPAFTTFADAQAFVNQYRGSTVGGQLAQNNLAPHIGNPLTGINAIGDFFQRLTQSSTWVRVGEFIAGGLLIYIGLNAITRGPARSEAMRTAKKVVNVGKKVAK